MLVLGRQRHWGVGTRGDFCVGDFPEEGRRRRRLPGLPEQPARTPLPPRAHTHGRMRSFAGKRERRVEMDQPLPAAERVARGGSALPGLPRPRRARLCLRRSERVPARSLSREAGLCVSGARGGLSSEVGGWAPLKAHGGRTAPLLGQRAGWTRGPGSHCLQDPPPILPYHHHPPVRPGLLK